VEGADEACADEARPDVEGANDDADEARPDVEGANDDADESCIDFSSAAHDGDGFFHGGGVQDMYEMGVYSRGL
jgi:hypothetical protein